MKEFTISKEQAEKAYASYWIMLYEYDASDEFINDRIGAILMYALKGEQPDIKKIPEWPMVKLFVDIINEEASHE